MMLSTIIVMAACITNAPVQYSTGYSIVVPGLIPCCYQEDSAAVNDHNQTIEINKIVPDVDIQNAIRLYLEAVHGDQERNEWETQTFITMLKEACQNDLNILIQQTVYYAAHAKRVLNKEGMMNLRAFWFVREEMDIDNVVIVEALLPYLQTRDLLLKKEIYKIFGVVEDVTSGRTPDYYAYRVVIQMRVNRKRDLPRNLIQYMYETNPGGAAILLVKTIRQGTPASRKSIFLAEHCVDDILWKWKYGFMERGSVTEETIEALIAVAQSKQWWARMYVAEILRKHPPFRDERILEIMIDETDPSVRAILSEFMPLNEVDPNDDNYGEGETEAGPKE